MAAASVATQGDHRIAMAFLTLGLAAEQPVEVDRRRDDCHQLPRLRTRHCDAIVADIADIRMSINSFGHLLRLTTWGESHGPGDRLRRRWLPAGAGARWPNRGSSASSILRRPGTVQECFAAPGAGYGYGSCLAFTKGRTAGTPIAMMIENVDTAKQPTILPTAPYRPGHADFTYDAKYGLRDRPWRWACFGA